MNISEKQKKEIYSLLNDAIKTDNTEYEVVFKTYNEYYSLSKPNFDKINSLFRKAGYKQKIVDTLNIFISDETDKEITYRLYLNDKNDIYNYYKTNLLNIKEEYFIDKKRKKEVFEIDDYNLRINLKFETSDITDKERVYVLSQINNQSVEKAYRKRTRYSYTKDGKNFQIDLSILKQNDNIIRGTKLPRNIFSYPENYEVEIELLKDTLNSKSLVDKKLLDELYKEQINLTGNILKYIQDTEMLMTNDEIVAVQEHYMKLGYPDVDKQKIVGNRGMYFGTRQPQTISRENLVETLGIDNILKNYTVTEKADGEKMILIVFNKNIYIMNKTFNLHKLKATCNIDNCILEGEYVKRIAYDDYIEYYLIYDAHIFDGKKVFNKKLIGFSEKQLQDGGENNDEEDEDDEDKSKKSKKPKVKKTTAKSKKEVISTDIKPDTRLYYMKEFLSNINNNKSLVVFKVKEFEYKDPKIFRNAYKVLKEHSYDYNRDGIIFTSDYALQDISSIDNIKIFKWKPAEENTIDFLVKFQGYNDNNYTNRFALCVGYNELLNIDPLSLIYKKHRVKLQDTSNLQYYPKIFDFAQFPAKDKKSFAVDNQEEIKNNMIVECLCVIDENKNKSWIPKRIRWDKTKLFNTTNNISSTANDYRTTVKDIMRLVNNPITEKMIIGEEEIVINYNIDETYYTGNIEELIEITNFKTFQNLFGKDPLFQMFNKGDYKLLDFACGQGGDMHKQYGNHHIKNVLGLDVSFDNIYASGFVNKKNTKFRQIEGAYRRYINQLGYINPKQKKIDNTNSFLYVVMDLNKNMSYIQENGLISQEYKNIYNSDLLNNASTSVYKYKSVNENNNYFIDLIFGNLDKSEVKEEYPSLKEYYNSLNTNHFDLISSMFSIHYAFVNIETLDNYCQNVTNNLKKGGYFFGITMDGYLVNKALEDKKNISGVINGKIMWNIKRKYVKYHKEPERNIGLTISNFFQSIGREYDEYLVDFNLLDKKMKEYGLETLTDKDYKELEISDPKSFYYFQDIYNNALANGKIKVNKKKTNQEINIHEELLPYSFMYRRFIYKKIK